jgi:hypothetical protein
MLIRLLLGFIAWQTVVPAAPAPEVGRLTDGEVLQAIAAGVAAGVEPRLLYEADSRVRPMGVAYSPAMRIGLATRAALGRNGEFSLADVPDSWRDPVVYVALRCPGCGPGTDVPMRLSDPETRVVLARHGVTPTLGRNDRVQPLWVSKDPTAILATFGAKPPYDDVGLVAAFPTSALRPDWRVIAYRRDPESGREQYFGVWVAGITIDDVVALRR